MTDWRTMDTLVSETSKLMFWLDWADDAARLNPPIPEGDYDRRLFIGKYRCWGSHYKAVRWALLPIGPALPSQDVGGK